MTWQSTPFNGPLLISAAVSLAAALYLIFLSKHRSTGVSLTILILLAGTGWLTSLAFEYAGADLATKIFWLKIKEISIVVMVVSWLAMTFFMLGYHLRYPHRWLIVVTIPTAISSLLMVTNDWHHLVWKSHSLVSLPDMLDIHTIDGVIYPFHTYYIYGVLALTALLLLRALYAAKHVFRKRAAVMLLSAVLPAVLAVLDITGFPAVPTELLAPVAYFMGVMPAIWSVNFMGAGDVVPIARANVIESIRDTVIVLDTKHRIVDINTAGLKLLNRPSHELIGAPVRDCCPRMADIIEHLPVNHGVVHEEFIGEDANGPVVLNVQISPIINWQGRKISSVIVMHDITRRKRIEEELKQSNAKLEAYAAERTSEASRSRVQMQAILDSMGEGLIYTDPGTIYLNPAFTEMTGYTVDDLKDGIATLFDTVQMASLLSFSTMFDEDSDFWQGATKIKKKHGGALNARLTVTPVGTDGAVIIVQDISKEISFRQQKDRFMTNASHELRTPLTSIKMRIYLMRKQPEKLAEHLAVVSREVEHTEVLLNQLLTISNFHQGVVDLELKNQIIQHVLIAVLMEQKPVAQQQGLTILEQLPPNPIVIRADYERMRKALSTLLGTLTSYAAENSEITVELQEENGNAHLQFHANKTSIPTDTMLAILEPFSQTTQDAAIGTSLELAMASEIIKAHGGKIKEAPRQEEAGTTLSIRLPLRAWTTPR